MIYIDNRTKRGPIRSVIIRVTRELAQQDSRKTQDGTITKKCGARLCIPDLSRHLFVILLSWVFQASCCVSSLLGSLSTHLFETRTTTGSELFPLLTCFHTTTFTLLSIFSPLEMISTKIWETPLSWRVKCSLPVAVRVSKTRVLKLIGRPRSGCPLSSITSMIHNQIQFLRKQMPYFFWLKCFYYQMLTESLFKVTNSPILENPKFDRVGGRCYGYCDKLWDWWIKLSALNMISWCNCPISGIRLQPTVRFHCPIQPYTIIVKNKALYAPMKFEKIVMVMMNV